MLQGQMGLKHGRLENNARGIGPESTSHESSDCNGGLSTGGEVCWRGIPKIGKVM